MNVRDNSISSNEGTINQLGNLMNRVIERADHSNDQRIYKDDGQSVQSQGFQSNSGQRMLDSHLKTGFNVSYDSNSF